MQYADALPALITDNIGNAPLTVGAVVHMLMHVDDLAFQVWTSTLRRTIQTARNLPYTKLTWKSLDELDAGAFYPLLPYRLLMKVWTGVCDGMTYEVKRFFRNLCSQHSTTDI